MTQRLSFRILAGRYALLQLPAGSPRPDWVRGEFTAIIDSPEGLSVVCAEDGAPALARARTGFRCLEIAGSFEIESVGIVAAAVRPLAAIGVSVFVYSTWETDYLLVQECDLPLVTTALKEAGHGLS